MAYEWNELGINEITNLYLYGQLTTPNDLTGASLIPLTPTDADGEKIDVNISSYMTAGPGRYALGSRSAMVKSFFSSDIQESWFEPGREYSKEEFAQILKDHGLGSLIASPTQAGKDYYGIDIHQSTLDVTSEDYLQRSYVWNSGSFKLADRKTPQGQVSIFHKKNCYD